MKTPNRPHGTLRIATTISVSVPNQLRTKRTTSRTNGNQKQGEIQG